MYVDPTIYKAVDEAVEEFAYEIARTSLTFGQLIGGGEFAEVYTGTLLKASGKSSSVAIKTLKVNTYSFIICYRRLDLLI